MIVPHPEWSKHDAEVTKQFFNTPTWLKIVEMVKVSAPDLNEKTTEAVAMTAKERKGWGGAINAFFEVLAIKFDRGTEKLLQVDPNKFSSKKSELL